MKAKSIFNNFIQNNFFIKYWGAFGLLTLATICGYMLVLLPESYTSKSFTNIGMVYLVATIFSSVRLGIRQSLITAIGGFLLYHLLFRKEIYLGSIHELINFMIFISASFIAVFLGSSSKQKLDKEHLENALQKERQNLDKEELRSSLLASVTHDLKTPLASVIGSLSSVIQVKTLSELDKKKLISTAYKEAVRLNDFISNILNMTKLESGLAEPDKEWLNPVLIVNGLVKRLSSRLKRRKVLVNEPKTPIELNVDNLLFEHVMQNLLDNAVKYSKPKSVITINIKENGIIQVINQGEAIMEGDKEKIFDKFHRSSKQDRSIAGTGLGLSICKAIMDIHDGEIKLNQTIYSEKNTEICFSLTFPEINKKGFN